MKDTTKLVTAGRSPEQNHGVVNPPVYHASTILYPDLKALRNFTKQRVSYGRYGTPGTHAFEDAMCEIENGDHCVIAPSGLAAVAASLLGFLKAGDHLLMVDTTYEPTRYICDGLLAQFGIETTYYDPLITDEILTLMRPNTRVVYFESPGSVTFEMQDIPALLKCIKGVQNRQAAEVITMIDNTWATPLYFKPLDFGVDLSIQAVTKYVGGHADLMMGTIVCKNEHWPALDRIRRLLGLSAAPDDAYLAQRGLRTLSVRLQRHAENALVIAEWLARRPEVKRIIYPALPDDPGHTIWARDFSGATGLFGFVLNEGTDQQIDALVSGNKLLGMGFSWGGYESLLIPTNPARSRSATEWTETGPTFRIHVGLEDPKDIVADLEAAFSRYNSAMA